MAQASTRMPLVLALVLWVALASYRGYDFYEFQRRENARREAAAKEEATLRAQMADRGRITPPSVDVNWEGHQKIEILLERNQTERMRTSRKEIP